MKRLLMAVAVGVVATLWSLSAQAAATDAQTIIDRVRATWQGDSFHGVLTLEISLGEQTKSHTLEVWTLGEDYSLIRMVAPDADAGAGYLQVKDDLWYYSPAVGMTIKLPSLVLGDALFGAGPSLADLSRGTLSDDYDAVATATEDGYLLTLTPHPAAPVVYGRLDIRVNGDYAIEKIVYYDQRGNVLRTATFSRAIMVNDRSFPTEIIVEDASGDRTIERIENPEFDIAIDPSFFTLDRLEEKK